jgi:hypothetical protein
MICPKNIIKSISENKTIGKDVRIIGFKDNKIWVMMVSKKEQN